MFAGYLIVILLLIVGLWAFFEFKHFSHRFSSILWIVFILFFVLSFLYVFKDQPVDFKTTTGLKTAFKVYGSWIYDSFGNVKQLTGQAINMDWRGNSTALT